MPKPKRYRLYCEFSSEEDMKEWRSNFDFAMSDETILMRATRFGSQNVLRWLLQELKFDVNEQNCDGDTALHYAADKGNKVLVEALLSWGAEVDRQDLEGRTPLYGACEEGHLACVTTLLKAGASFSLPTNDGSLPIHIAAQNNKIEVVGTLLQLGCTPNVVSCNEIKFHRPPVPKVSYFSATARVE